MTLCDLRPLQELKRKGEVTPFTVLLNAQSAFPVHADGKCFRIPTDMGVLAQKALVFAYRFYSMLITWMPLQRVKSYGIHYVLLPRESQHKTWYLFNKSELKTIFNPWAPQVQKWQPIVQIFKCVFKIFVCCSTEILLLAAFPTVIC